MTAGSPYALGPICAQRTLESTYGPVEVVMGVPRQEGEDVLCVFEIRGPKTRMRSHAFGVDAFQALELAMPKIGTDLLFSEEGQTGALRWLDQPGDLGFPLPAPLADMDKRRR